ncbi:sulfatase-like hydrolase/transferase [Carboxylicivirga marina]|uniref:sulfatase-like hydrolase/transferase n=1 Tax=Carboxylicivirga marina TaxID=2800988 RepID=UPI002594903A|nr:sulfatase-like hydrolase/transferase [uncultured Carboxylicivirga sp.]
MKRFTLFMTMQCFVFGLAFSKKNKVEKLPHIVYVLVDDMGQGDLSCYNPESKIPTVNLDKLAEQGMRFTDAHSGSAVCTPTRYGILTGRYCWRSELKERVVSGYDPCIVDKDRSTVATLLSRNGYQTAMIGKWHLGLNWATKDGSKITELKNDIVETEKRIDFTRPLELGPTHLGFNYFYGIAASWDFPPYIFIENDRLVEQPNGKKGGWIGDLPEGHTLETIEKNKKKYPLASWRDGVTGSLGPKDAVKVITDKTVDYINEFDNSKPQFLFVCYTSPHTPVVPRDEFKGTSQCGIYGDFCVELDDAVGQIITALKEKGVYDNTLFVFTADNGSSLKGIPITIQKKYNHSPSYIYKGYKARLDEGGHRVPFITSWPAAMPMGEVNYNLISLNDLYATCAELVGEDLSNNEAEDSYSILADLKGVKTVTDTERVIVHSDFTGYFAIRKGDWKLTFPRAGKENELFNLKNDPGEKSNLMDKHKEKADELTKLLTKVVKEGRSNKGTPVLNDGPKHWEQLTWMKE